MITGRSLGPAVLAGLAAVAGPARADCRGLISAAQQAINQRDVDAIAAATDAATAEPTCPGATKDAVRRSAAAALADTALRQLKDGRRIETLEPTIRMAQRYGERLWQAQYLTGDLDWAEGDRTAAAVAYDAAWVQAVQDEKAGHGPGKEQLAQLKLRAEEARALAPAMVSSRTDLRDLAVVEDSGAPPVPSVEPITFETAKTTFDERGRSYAQDLAKRISEASPPHIRLVGHTDERGDPAFNMKLSLDRARALGAYLVANGYGGAVEVAGRGATQPRTLSEGAGYTQEEIWRLNRRVEVFVGGAP